MNYDYKLHIIIRNHKRAEKQQNKMIIYKPVLQKYPHRLLISRHHPPAQPPSPAIILLKFAMLPHSLPRCLCFQDSLSLSL